MAHCVKISRKRRKVCLGDMRDLINISNVNNTAPTQGGVDVTANRVTVADLKALVETVQAIEVFDGQNMKGVVTHTFQVRYLDGVDSESQVLWKGIAYDIIDTENYDGREEFLLIRCGRLGNQTLEVNNG